MINKRYSYFFLNDGVSKFRARQMDKLINKLISEQINKYTHTYIHTQIKFSYTR